MMWIEVYLFVSDSQGWVVYHWNDQTGRHLLSIITNLPPPVVLAFAAQREITELISSWRKTQRERNEILCAEFLILPLWSIILQLINFFLLKHSKQKQKVSCSNERQSHFVWGCLLYILHYLFTCFLFCLSVVDCVLFFTRQVHKCSTRNCWMWSDVNLKRPCHQPTKIQV